MTTSRKTWSWRTRLLVLLLLFAVVPLLGISIWSLEKLEETHESNTVDALEAIAHARAEAIDQIIGNRRRDVERIVNQVLPRLISLREAEAQLAAELTAQLAAPVPTPLALPLPEASRMPSSRCRCRPRRPTTSRSRPRMRRFLRPRRRRPPVRREAR